MNTADAIVKRYACKSFQSDATLPEDPLKKILALTQRAPTCFNSQPWVAVVVRRGTPESDKLVEASFATNQQRIKEAAATVVFCADLEPTRNLDKMADLSAEVGYDRNAALAKLSLPIKLIGWHVKPFCWVISVVKAVVFPVVGLFKPVMTAMLGESTRTWAIKQTMLPASTFMIAATSLGFATSPMEGFDSNRARIAVRLPKRYVPTVLISIGHAKEEPKVKSLRFDPEDVFFDGNYSKPYRGIEPAVSSPKDKTN